MLPVCRARWNGCCSAAACSPGSPGTSPRSSPAGSFCCSPVLGTGVGMGMFGAWPLLPAGKTGLGTAAPMGSTVELNPADTARFYSPAYFCITSSPISPRCCPDFGVTGQPLSCRAWHPNTRAQTRPQRAHGTGGTAVMARISLGLGGGCWGGLILQNAPSPFPTCLGAERGARDVLAPSPAPGARHFADVDLQLLRLRMPGPRELQQRPAAAGAVCFGLGTS